MGCVGIPAEVPSLAVFTPRVASLAASETTSILLSSVLVESCPLADRDRPAVKAMSTSTAMMFRVLRTIQTIRTIGPKCYASITLGNHAARRICVTSVKQGKTRHMLVLPYGNGRLSVEFGIWTTQFGPKLRFFAIAVHVVVLRRAFSIRDCALDANSLSGNACNRFSYVLTAEAHCFSCSSHRPAWNNAGACHSGN
jgi:hypothetical protein